MKTASKTLGTIAGVLMASHFVFANTKTTDSPNVKETKVVPGYVKSTTPQSSAAKEVPGYSGKKTALQSNKSSENALHSNNGAHGGHNAHQP